MENKCIHCGLTKTEAKKIGEHLDFVDGKILCDDCFLELYPDAELNRVEENL